MVAFADIVVNFLRAARKDRDQHFAEVCWSLVPGFHLDRAAVVSGLAKALPVVKPL